MKTFRGLLCWLLGHNYKEISRKQYYQSDNISSEIVGFICQHCRRGEKENWDWE